jgi:hypothetical protein
VLHKSSGEILNFVYSIDVSCKYSYENYHCFHVNILEIIMIRAMMAVPWLRRLVTGIPPRRPGFDPGSVHVGFVVDKLALGQVFPPSTSVFPCQFHPTGAPLLGKMEKNYHLSLHLHHMVAQ